jgi:hypothetical protein
MEGNARRTRVLKWLGISALGLVLLLITLLVALSSVYDKAIIKYLKKNLNEHLLTEIIVEDIDFSMIRKFPYATVEFTNVFVRSKAGLHQADFETTDQDTLLSASKVYFQFGLFGLMRNEYQLKRIQLINGKINLLTDKTGRRNYAIWRSLKKEPPAKDIEGYNIEFNNVVVSSFHLKVINQNQSFSLNSIVKKLVFAGSFSADSGNYALKSGLLLLEADHHGKVLIKNMPLSFDFKASSQQHDLTIRQGEMLINKLLIQLNGHILLDSSHRSDLYLYSVNFGPDEILSLLPKEEKSRLNDFAADGKGKINMRVKGPLSVDHFPSIQADFSLSGGSLTNKNTRSKLSGFSLSGKFTGNKPSNYSLDISHMEARLSTGKMRGKAHVFNLQNPVFSADLYSTINLNNLFNLIDLDTIEYLNGKMEAHLEAAGSLADARKFSAANLLANIKSGYFDFDDCAVKIKGLDYALEDINGKILIDNNLSLQNFALNLNQTSFLVTGSIEGLFSHLTDKESVISSNLYLYSKYIDGNSFIRPSQDPNQAGAGIILPGFLSVRAKINADEFRIGKFNATNLKCELSYAEKELDINTFNFKFIDGDISGNSLINQLNDSCLLISCFADLNYIDIQQLFTAFNNFSQQFILDENLRGKLSGKATFMACWDNQLNFIPSSLIAQADAEIINGELLKFDPMLSLSKYINVEELKHIKFKTLKNTIFIFDQHVWIPEMVINSSAFNIALSGTHSFENDFDYRLRVALSDVLFKKARRKKQEMEEYLIMEDAVEKTVIPISIIGNPDDFKVAFDSKRAFDLIRENLQQQGAEMKSIFGRKNISSPEKSGEKMDQPAFEWKEDQTKSPLLKEKKTHQAGDEIRIKWEEEDSSDFDFFH